jgi:hypothetical protein
MKKVITIYTNRDGTITVEHERTMELFHVLESLGEATRIVYKEIVEEQARRASMDKDELDKLARLVAKQKRPKLN